MFTGIRSAHSAVVVLDQNYQYIEQTAGNVVPAEIATIYAGDAYIFYISSDYGWLLTNNPTGLKYSVNGGTLTQNVAVGTAGMASVVVQSDPDISENFIMTLNVLQNGELYTYQLKVLPSRTVNGTFACPKTEVNVTPGFEQTYTNVVGLSVVGNPVTLTNGQLLGTSPDGKVTVVYSGETLTLNSGYKQIPVTVKVAVDAAVGTYNIDLDQVIGVDSGCSWTINVTAPVCVFTLDCTNPTISPNDFTQGVSADSDVSINYTLTGCTTFNFEAISINSTNVNGLVLDLNAQTITSASGTITGSITGTPTSSGTATFDIPGYCSICVTVKAPATGVFDVICSDYGNVAAYLRKTLNMPMETSYTLTSGTKEISAWTGTAVNGVYVYVPAQTVSAPSGVIEFYLKGTPTKIGTITLPININGTLCYVKVVINKSGSCCSHGSNSSSCCACKNQSSSGSGHHGNGNGHH